ncbi:MAG TPA: MXAN_2562 family outer membrane beta-barrel protein [Polyangiaceae bacterium]|nr:MXAN_2562 family outer membrane beta-barrel protein [Polyangiaceae bacterium]
MNLKTLVPLGALAALTLFAPEARAQSDDTGGYLATRDPSRFDSPQNFAFELRFGPYRPEIDSESEFESLPEADRPFRRTFGKGKGFHFGFEFDWQAVRIPFVGTFGPGFGWSRSSRSAKAFVLNSTTDRSGEDTTLVIMPMYAVGVLRADYLAREYGVPLVPYAKAGLGFALWSSSISTGVVTRDGVEGRGRSWGPHYALGAAFLLDVIDPSAAHSMDKSVGVNNTYAYIEWMRNDLGDLLESKPQMRVGTSTWVTGLALEF